MAPLFRPERPLKASGSPSIAGLRALIGEATRRLAPRSTKTGTAVVTADAAVGLAELDRIRDDCRRLVMRRAAWSAGTAVIPLPGLDVGTDIAILIKLLPKINERFGLTPQQIDQLDVESKRLVMVFASSVGSKVIGRLVTREVVLKLLLKMGVRVTTAGIVKFVPLLGQALSASLSFGAMKLLGDKHIDDCYEVARRALLYRAESTDLTTLANINPRS